MNTIKLGCERMYYGEGALQGLAQLPSERKKAFIVMSGTILQELGQLALVTNVLEEAGFSIETYPDVEPEPSFESIRRGADAMIAFEPDWIIGFGGGSAMDAAKAMWVFYENPECRELADVVAPNEICNLKKKARVACIPTSAGTGSEATRVAVIKDAKLKKKFSIRCLKGRMVPDVAVLDPVFSVSMPKGLTAASGMDAITHAIEAYVTPLANPFSDALAIQALRLGFENLAECYENPTNLPARANMLASSYLAGVAFSNCALGIVHSIAHTFGAEYGVPHGLANAIVLPYVINFNMKDAATKAKYDELAYLLHEKSLLEVVLSLCKRVGIPTCMKAVVKDEADVNLKMDELVEKALGDVCTPFTPVKPLPQEMKSLIQAVYNGNG